MRTRHLLNLKNHWQQVVDESVAMGKASHCGRPAQVQPIFLATSLALILTILVVTLTGWVVNVTITQPLRRLSSLTARIAKGYMQARASVMGHEQEDCSCLARHEQYAR